MTGLVIKADISIGDTVNVTYRTYLNSQQADCPSNPADYERFYVPRAMLDMQMRWCSCLNTLGRVTGYNSDEFIMDRALCEQYYCTDNYPDDPSEGRDYEDRVGWFEPIYWAYNVSQPTVRYPWEDRTDLFPFEADFEGAPPGVFNPNEDHDNDGINEGVHYQDPLPYREYEPHCETADAEDTEIERRAHQKELLWTWVDEYMPVPGGGGFGAQVRSLDGHCMMLWLRSDRSGFPEDNQYSSNVMCPPIRCDSYPLLYFPGWVRPVIFRGGPLPEDRNREIRIIVEIENGLGYELETYLYPDPVGQNAGIEGLIVQSYIPAEDSLGEPYRSIFVPGTAQIEGRGLGVVEVTTPWPNEVEEERLLLAYGGAYTDGTFDDRVWLGRVIEGQGIVEWSEPLGPHPDDEERRTEPPGRARGVFLASPVFPDRAVLFGGETEQGLAADLWTYSANEERWAQFDPKGEVPSPRAEMGFAQTADLRRAYLFGGQAQNSLSDELFVLDLETLSFELLWSSAGSGYSGPEPRRGAAVALDEGLGQVYVYGGIGDQGPVNDLWALDLRSGSWTQLSQICVNGFCPPLARNAALVYDEGTHRVRVVMGRADVPYQDPTWSFAPVEGWTSWSTFGWY